MSAPEEQRSSFANRCVIGDCRETLLSIPKATFHCCVTSPPYWGLRDYGLSGRRGVAMTKYHVTIPWLLEPCRAAMALTKTSEGGQTPSSERPHSGRPETSLAGGGSVRASTIPRSNAQHLITANGETHCIAEWSRRLGIPDTSTIRGRIARGWPPARAVTEPVGRPLVNTHAWARLDRPRMFRCLRCGTTRKLHPSGGSTYRQLGGERSARATACTGAK